MLAAVVGWGLSSATYALVIPVLQRGDVGPFSWQWHAAFLPTSLLSGAITGLLQWLILKRYVGGVAWWTWTLAITAGVLLTYPFDFAVTSTVLFYFAQVVLSAGEFGATASVFAGQFISSLIEGVIAGALQWLVLQRHLRNAAIWILAVLGSQILSGLLATVPVVMVQSRGAFMSDLAAYSSILSFFVGLPIIASITGFTLLWLVNHTRRSNRRTYETSQ
jgi:hypothetical protein